jgi:hypothetical protein
MDDFHIVTDVESLMVCCHKCDHAIFNIYILLLAVNSVYILDT